MRFGLYFSLESFGKLGNDCGGGHEKQFSPYVVERVLELAR